jgi:hypothetical protein
MPPRRKWLLTNVISESLLIAWVAVLLILFFLTQAPASMALAIGRAPHLAPLADWRVALLSRLSAAHRQ